MQFMNNYKVFSDISVTRLPLSDLKNTRWTKRSEINHNSPQYLNFRTSVPGSTAWIIHSRKLSQMQYYLTWLLVATCPFLEFSAFFDSKYSHVCRRTMMPKIENLAAEKRSVLKTQLSKTDHVSVSVDIWSGQKKWGFLSVNVRRKKKETERKQLKSKLLTCDHLHMGERICEQFEAKCDE